VRVPIDDHITVVPAAVRVVDIAPTSAVLVLPGGAYAGHATHEAEAVAHWVASAGWHAFVLRYPVSYTATTNPLYSASLEAAIEAIGWIRGNAHGLSIAANSVGVLGFSAGGHLAASLSNAGALANAPDATPDFAVLCYPVISMVRDPLPRVIRRLFGLDPQPAELARMSLETQVTSATPPTFLWHTADDLMVPVSHSLVYAHALAAHNVSFELHVFPEGQHGLGLGYSNPTVRQWTSLCEDWIRRGTGPTSPSPEPRRSA